MSKTIAITLTEGYENFSDCVNRAHYQGVTFVLMKRGVPFARIVPDGEEHRTKPDAKTSAMLEARKPLKPLHIPTDHMELRAEFKANEQRLEELKDAELVRVAGPNGIEMRGQEEVAERKLRIVHRTAMIATMDPKP